jgi:hypothetical protein
MRIRHVLEALRMSDLTRVSYVLVERSGNADNGPRGLQDL